MVLYVKGTNEFRGIYRFAGDWYPAPEPIWAEETESQQILFPYQIQIEPVATGRADVKKLVPSLRFIIRKEFPYWPLYLKGTPANASKPISEEDFTLILEEMKRNPLETVERPPVEVAEEDQHTKMQYILIQLGKIGKCDVWVARGDRGRSYGGQRFEDLCLEYLPNLGFSQEVMKLVENIDVLWMRGNVILAAFEIEHTTSIYGGLLRLSDLINLVPNVKIQLFIVAPEKRKDKVIAEVNRPTFSSPFLETPLNSICRVWTYEDLVDTYESLKSYRFPPTWCMEHLVELGEPALR
jgi:hypothetical protein